MAIILVNIELKLWIYLKTRAKMSLFNAWNWHEVEKKKKENNNQELLRQQVSIWFTLFVVVFCSALTSTIWKRNARHAVSQPLVFGLLYRRYHHQHYHHHHHKIITLRTVEGKLKESEETDPARPNSWNSTGEALWMANCEITRKCARARKKMKSCEVEDEIIIFHCCAQYYYFSFYFVLLLFFSTSIFSLSKCFMPIISICMQHLFNVFKLPHLCADSGYIKLIVIVIFRFSF